MNTTDLVMAVSESEGLPRKEVTAVVNAVLETIRQQVKLGNEVRLQKFGTFKVGETKAKKGRNPRTGESINIEASRKVRFLAGKELKTEVAKKSK